MVPLNADVAEEHASMRCPRSLRQGPSSPRLHFVGSQCSRRGFDRGRTTAISGVFLLVSFLMGATCGVPPASDLPPPALETSELLGAGDVVEIRIFNEADLSGTHQISDSGQVRLPLVGALTVSGMTPDQLSQAITEAYNAKFLKNAEVSIFVKERNSQKVFVLGQVGKPGPISIEAGKMTVIEAIARAGGTTKLADASRALLTRDHDGRQIRVSVDVAAIGKGQAPDVTLQPGDILFVPETIF
jgi:polysaccharide export outer membrane protein